IWEDDTLYIVGTGSTTAAIMKRMNLSGTLLGVDLVYQKKVIASDCTEKEILDIMEQYEKKKIIVTVIGGQGYIFGRGNQQISAEVIRRAGRDNIIVAASKNTMLALFGKPLYADTGNEEINRYLEGYIRVVVGYKDIIMARVTSGDLR
ncbi:MAG: ATP-NAD kinase, partial [Lachnospiraceae bacterium]|nr:ATP-NAD kinase [Lachnospiraceae bacterium]